MRIAAGLLGLYALYAAITATSWRPIGSSEERPMGVGIRALFLGAAMLWCFLTLWWPFGPP
jgi:hypothetical protein